MFPIRLGAALREAVTVGPDLFLAVTCLLALVYPEVEQRFGPRIGLILGLEFIGLHAFGFLGQIALAEPTRRSTRILRVPAFIALCVVYTVVILDWGAGAALSFWVVMLSTYAGFLFHDEPAQRRSTLAYRWGIAFGLFFGVAIVAGLTAEYFNLRSPRKEFLFGFLFFAALALCDLFRLYDRLAHRFSGSPAVSGNSPP